MFSFLQNIDDRIYNRFLTVERNIKAASNSFYDSFLDMLEQFIKTVVEQNEFDLTGTCGQILMRQEMRTFFVDVAGVDEFTFGKLRDYTQKVNAHKHKGEKNVIPDTVVTYMKIFHTATASYAKYKGIVASEYNANYFIGIFGEFGKQNRQLQIEVEQLKGELSTLVEEHKLTEFDIHVYESLLSKTALERMSLEDQNMELYRQISVLKDIKLSSMEEKLNRTIELLLELKPAIVENRVITRVVGSKIGKMISGSGDVDQWIADEKEKNAND